MDATVVVTSVHNKEITREIDVECERGLSRFIMGVDKLFVLEHSYRGKRFGPFYDLDAILVFELEQHDSEHGTTFLERYTRCRTMAWRIYYPETNLIRVQSNSCRLRWCPVCGEARVNIIKHNCFEFFSEQSYVRFLTLTLKHSGLSLNEQIRRMKKCFVKLSQRVGWKKYVTGTVAFLHVKWNEKTGWHVHLHILLTGLYLPQEWLSAEWLKVTGDSIIVHVQACYSEKKLAATIKDFVRYAGCPANLRETPMEHRQEIIHAFEGIRVCWTTGICRAISLSPPRYKQGDAQGINLGRDSTLRMRAKEGNLDALKILFCSEKGVPWNKIASGNPHSFRDDDDFIDDKFLGLSEAEPDEWVKRERPPPEKNLFEYEGDELDENTLL